MAGVTFELEACPHCGSRAQIRDHAVYRYHCPDCGNPRLPVDGRWLKTPPHIASRLGSVRRHHIQKGLWKAGSWVAWVIALVTALFGAGTAWSLDFSFAGWIFIGVLIAIPMLAGVIARLTANKHERQVTPQLEEAWRDLAAFFFTSSPTPRSLADVQAAFGVDPESAMKLLAEGEVASYLAQGGTGVDWERQASGPDAAEQARFRVSGEQAQGDSAAVAGEDDEAVATSNPSARVVRRD